MVTDGVIQARGVWHRPNVTGTETNLEGVCAVLDTFRKTGINLVFLETFFHGMTVYRTNLIPYYAGFDAFDYSPYPDYLSAFVAEAEKRGIEVHAWVEDFYVGVDENYFTKYVPQWLMLTKDGSKRQTEGADYGGYLFLDPANPEVRQYLIRFYHEILTKFPQIAGLNLDYIRYPISSQSDDTGFTDAAMNGFAAENDITFPENATREQKVQAVASQYGKWVNYRAKQVTTFVGEVYEMVKTQHPGVLLSTAVFPEQGKSFGDKKQDFNTWLERGYLDIITPMAYYDDIPTLKRALEAMLPGLSACYCYAGISPTYHNLPDEQVLAQMQTAVESGADGFVFFGSQSILNKPQYIDLLEETLPEDALLPHTDAKSLMEATMERVQKKLTDAGEAEKKVEELVGELGEMARQAEGGKLSQLEQVRKQLRLMVKFNLASYVTGDHVELIRQDMELLMRCINVQTTRMATKSDGVEEEPAPEEPEPSEGPTAPEEQVDHAEEKPKQLAPMLAIGAVLAAAIATTTAIFYKMRKERRKWNTK